MLEIHETPLAQGVVVGDRYQLEAIIGEGGMGVVWAATDTSTEAREQRALKFIRRDRTADARNEARLLREAKALSTIAHDNVARVFEVSELPDGTPFLVMERLVGETLKQRISRLERLPFEDCVRIARGIANGVRAAHAMGIVHRDLKPDNVFIENDGDVKVLDFGIAKELRSGSEGGSAAEGASSLTTTGAMLGTLHYMAPEQVFGDTDVDERADVWALGIVICECLSGKKPTEGSGSGQVLKAIMTKEFERLDAMLPGCPAAMADLVEAMLSRERRTRPTMSEVLEYLSIDFDDPAAVASTSKRISRPSARFRLRQQATPDLLDPSTTSETFSKSANAPPPTTSLRSSRLVWGAVMAVLLFASIVLFIKMQDRGSSVVTQEPTKASPSATMAAPAPTPAPTPTPTRTPTPTPTTSVATPSTPAPAPSPSPSPSPSPRSTTRAVAAAKPSASTVASAPPPTAEPPKPAASAPSPAPASSHTAGWSSTRN